jgi:hypothetical protein
MASELIPINCAVVGVQKAATSTLHALLVQHPAVAPTSTKELHFFDDESRDWEAPDYSRYTAERTGPHQRVACDSTPIYLFWPPALPRMRAYAPGMRLVALFRDPVERAFSHWMMQRSRDARMPTFDTLVTRSLDLGEPEVPPDRWRTARSRTRSIVARGFYGYQLARGLELYPRQQWLLLDFVDLVRDQATALRRVTDFLEVDPYVEPPSDEQQRKSAPLQETGPGDPSAAVLERLAEAYADDLRRFEELSGITTARWSTSRLLRGDLDSREWAAGLQHKRRSG